jgi:hypothetical protein
MACNRVQPWAVLIVAALVCALASTAVGIVAESRSAELQIRVVVAPSCSVRTSSAVSPSAPRVSLVCSRGAASAAVISEAKEHVIPQDLPASPRSSPAVKPTGLVVTIQF